MDNNSAITTRLLERARAGDTQAVNELKAVLTTMPGGLESV